MFDISDGTRYSRVWQTGRLPAGLLAGILYRNDEPEKKNKRQQQRGCKGEGMAIKQIENPVARKLAEYGLITISIWIMVVGIYFSNFPTILHLEA